MADDVNSDIDRAPADESAPMCKFAFIDKSGKLIGDERFVRAGYFSDRLNIWPTTSCSMRTLVASMCARNQSDSATSSCRRRDTSRLRSRSWR